MGVDEIMDRRVDKIKTYVLKKLPEECGVYYFHNKEGKIIYIGKSNNMYHRALSHFNSHEKKGGNMLNELYDASYQLTGNELLALLIESEEIKKHKPEFNRTRRADKFSHSIDWWKDDKGIINLKIVPYEESTNPLRSFISYISARERLEQWLDEYMLCLRYCGLTDNDAVCFNHHIKKCYGICAGEEEVEDYNLRASKIVDKYTFPNKDFLIVEDGRHREEKALIHIENGHYSGYGFVDTTGQMNSPEELKDSVKRTTFYPDNNSIIHGWIKNYSIKTVILNKIPDEY